MKPYEPWGQKPKNVPGNGFGSFGAPNGQKFIGNSTKPFGSFGVPGGQKPAASPNNGFGNFKVQPIDTFGVPAVPKPKPASANAFGALRVVGAATPKHNYWGDVDDDGHETEWDDFLGDGLLMDAMLAQQRAQRGAPPEPEDEFLIGRPYVAQRRTERGSSPAAGVLAGTVVVFGLFACVLVALAANLMH